MPEMKNDAPTKTQKIQIAFNLVRDRALASLAEAIAALI
jgi:hypothetical protein